MKPGITYFLLFLLLSACGMNAPEMKDGYSHLRELPAIKPKFSEELPVNYRLYAVSDTTGICYLELNPGDLLNKRDSTDSWFRNASFELVIKKSGISKEIIFKAKKSWLLKEEKTIIDSFWLQLPKNDDLWLEVTYSDLNKHTYFQEQRWWIRQKKLMSQHFLMLDPRSGTPLIRSYTKSDSLLVQSDYFSNQTLRAAQFNNLDFPALSPFAFGNAEPDFQKPDSVFSLTFNGNLAQIPLKSAFLAITRPDKPNEIAGFFTHEENDTLAAYLSMAYISSAAELVKFKDPAQVKTVFSQFWTKAAGNDKAKALKLQNEFFKRVKHANREFSSYKLGCLTDRGMIYIVFGAPEHIRKEGFQEVWTYQNAGIHETGFIFYYDQNQMAPNNCYLERASSYKGTYYIAVENWRNGLIQIYE